MHPERRKEERQSHKESQGTKQLTEQQHIARGGGVWELKEHDDDDDDGVLVGYLGGVDGAVEQRRDGAAADADVRLHGEPLEPHLHLGRLHAKPALHHMPVQTYETMHASGLAIATRSSSRIIIY